MDMVLTDDERLKQPAPNQEIHHVHKTASAEGPVGYASAQVQRPQQAQAVSRVDAVTAHEKTYPFGVDAGDSNAVVGQAVQPGAAVLSAAPEAPAQSPLGDGEYLLLLLEYIAYHLCSNTSTLNVMKTNYPIPAPWREAVKVAREALKTCERRSVSEWEVVDMTPKIVRAALAQLDSLESKQ